MTSPDTTTTSRRWLALALLLTSQFMVILDASVVNVALPSIQQDLGFSASGLQWVVNAYVIAFGGLLLLGGRVADLLGRRRMFVAGTLLFTVASLAAGLANSDAVLIAARALQGVGAAIVAPAALSLITTTFTEPGERNKALGIYGAVAGAGGAVGVLLSGVLTDVAGWPWVFYINIPVGVIVALLAPRYVTESRAQGVAGFDLAGALTSVAGLVTLVYAIVNASDAGWLSAETLGLLAVAGVLLAAFVAIEAARRSALVPLAIFRSRMLTAANVIGLVAGAAIFPIFYFQSLYLQAVLGFGPMKAGLAMLPMAATIMAVAGGLAPRAMGRFGFGRSLTAAMLILAAGLAVFRLVSADGSYLVDVLPALLIASPGIALAYVVSTTAAFAGVQEQHAGLASGLINTGQQIGGAIGLAALVTLSTGRTEDALATGSSPLVAMTDGFAVAFP